ncbi:MAG: hypothetical protein J3K34DRAFT_511741 [Monoraphidium minutum]|nr:MAG: hypothetical protein J3K34DRAFT_511741 [Monoraphidium minutum]
MGASCLDPWAPQLVLAPLNVRPPAPPPRPAPEAPPGAAGKCLTATRFDFEVHIHSLHPWPAGGGAIAVGWQRGKRRRGATAAALPLASGRGGGGGGGVVVQFNERIGFKAAGAADAAGALGPFKRKFLVLAVVEAPTPTDTPCGGPTGAAAAATGGGPTGAGAAGALARAVIDLSELAAAGGQEVRVVPLTCGGALRGAAGGEPRLTVTLRCRWKKAGTDFTEEEAASLSTDHSDSSLGGSSMAAGSGGGGGGRSGGGGKQQTQAQGGWATAAQVVVVTAGSVTGESASSEAADPESAAGGAAGSHAAAPRAFGGRWHRFLSRSRAAKDASSGELAAGPSAAAPAAPGGGAAGGAGGAEAGGGGLLIWQPQAPGGGGGEMLAAAATEVAVHLGRRALVPGRGAARAAHAPARRIVRTLVCLGHQEGALFGDAALRHMQAAALAGRGEPGQLAFWWSNAVHMRGFLQSLSLFTPQSEDGAKAMQWAAEMFVPRLLSLERSIFDELVAHVWTETLVPKVAAARSRAPSGAPPGANRRGGAEAALRKWMEALEAANGRLRGLGREGHFNALRQQVLLELLSRVDALLFHYLIHPAPAAGGGGGGELWEQPGFCGGGGGGVGGAPALDESLLFFARGALMFGTGMQLKMACARLQQWAFGEGGLRDIWAQLPGQGQALFRLLKGTSDLLMMPKALLLDADIRREAVGLPPATTAYIIARFEPDEFSPEGVPPAVLKALRCAAGAGGGAAAAVAAAAAAGLEGGGAYYSLPEDFAMERVEAGEEPGLEFGSDSEDELAAAAALGGGRGGAPPLRFQLLQRLWSAGVPRARRRTVQRAEVSDGGRGARCGDGRRGSSKGGGRGLQSQASAALLDESVRAAAAAPSVLYAASLWRGVGLRPRAVRAACELFFPGMFEPPAHFKALPADAHMPVDASPQQLPTSKRQRLGARGGASRWGIPFAALAGERGGGASSCGGGSAAAAAAAAPVVLGSQQHLERLASHGGASSSGGAAADDSAPHPASLQVPRRPRGPGGRRPRPAGKGQFAILRGVSLTPEAPLPAGPGGRSRGAADVGGAAFAMARAALSAAMPLGFGPPASGVLTAGVQQQAKQGQQRSPAPAPQRQQPAPARQHAPSPSPAKLAQQQQQQPQRSPSRASADSRDAAVAALAAALPHHMQRLAAPREPAAAQSRSRSPQRAAPEAQPEAQRRAPVVEGSGTTLAAAHVVQQQEQQRRRREEEEEQQQQPRDMEGRAKADGGAAGAGTAAGDAAGAGPGVAGLSSPTTSDPSQGSDITTHGSDTPGAPDAALPAPPAPAAAAPRGDAAAAAAAQAAIALSTWPSTSTDNDSDEHLPAAAANGGAAGAPFKAPPAPAAAAAVAAAAAAAAPAKPLKAAAAAPAPPLAQDVC